MGNVTYMSAEEIEREHTAEIDRWRSELEVTLAAALRELGNAARAVGQLNGDQLYDVEFAEGCGEDIGHHLNAAMRAVRAADALRFRAVAPDVGR